MSDHKLSRPVLAVAIAFVFVLILVIVVFLAGLSDDDRVEITLPEPTVEAAPANPTTGETHTDETLRITDNNVIAALTSLEKPAYYYQKYSVEIGTGTSAVDHTVDLWINDRYKRAQVSTVQTTRIILTDSEKLWLWYQDENGRFVEFDTTEAVTFEDLLALPGFDYLHTLNEANILETEYLVMESEGDVSPCIFLSADEPSGNHIRYWIDLETGLLSVADAMEGNTQVYRIEQTNFDRLADQDEVFNDKFLLPDGSSIIAEE